MSYYYWQCCHALSKGNKMKSALALVPQRKRTTIEMYDEMKGVMPLAKIINTAKRLDSSLSEDEIVKRADALAQWFAAIPIALKAGKWFQMIETIDVVWHAFILNTRDYARFCQMFYDGFLHHEPPMDYSEDRTEYARYTLATIREEFGDRINPELENLSSDVKCCFRYVVD